jgi:hypothetical protein
VVKLDVDKLLEAFNLEEREFLFEMVEPEKFESQATLQTYQQEELVDVSDIEDFANLMGRQQRRIAFINALHKFLGGVLTDD